MRALDGLKVLDLAWVMAGPMVGRALADFGATVVRVESSKRLDVARFMGPFPDGEIDPRLSVLFENCNVGKLGLALDLKCDEGRGVARELVRWADVVVESFAPGQMTKFGLDYEAIRKINPGVIMVSTSLMGQSGPLAQIAGFGSTGAALSGFQTVVGNPGEPPIGTFGPYTDYVAPRFSLFILLAALDHRSRTGEGMWIDVAQSEATVHFLAPQVALYDERGQNFDAVGNRDPSYAPHGVYPAQGEDRWIAIVARDDAEWAKLAEFMGMPELSRDSRFCTLNARKANEDALEAILNAWVQSHPADELERALQSQGIAAHIVASPADFFADRQLNDRGFFVRLPHPVSGETVVEATRFHLSDTPARYDRCAPPVGRDSKYVLCDLLGYSEKEFTALAEGGVLT
ncbi:CaiB/BaiF CoA transferase family protein [Rhodococcus sp. NPDC059968]|uniref:CaiB/BaiF CoA transferase family protein n=1 Tax=Rhodococcus sp. NPDC059968 TaxID=3347017 RepID=UPI00366E819D